MFNSSLSGTLPNTISPHYNGVDWRVVGQEVQPQGKRIGSDSGSTAARAGSDLIAFLIVVTFVMILVIGV